MIRLLAVLTALVSLGGCARDATRTSFTGRYTCAELAADFRKPGDAPADRGQAVVDFMVAKVSGGDQASTNVRDTTVYALASECSHRSRSWDPVPGALRAVQRIYRSR